VEETRDNPRLAQDTEKILQSYNRIHLATGWNLTNNFKEVIDRIMIVSVDVNAITTRSLPHHHPW
jgi:hypothetical protein